MLRSLLVLSLLSLPLAAAAQPPEPAAAPVDPGMGMGPMTAGVAPPVEALVAEALERSPAVAAARAQVAARREMEAPAGAPRDPSVEAMLQNVGFSPTIGDEDMSMVGAELRQDFPYPGKRAAARAVAEADTAAAEAALVALERQVAADVRRLYGRLYAIDREHESLTAAHELVDLLAETVRSRYATGETDQEAVLKAHLKSLRLDEMLADHEVERAEIQAELDRWLDRPAGLAIGTVGELPVVSAAPAAAAELAAHESAEVARAAAAFTAAERRVEAARLDLRPDFSAGAGLGYRGSLDPVVLASFGVELPFWRRQKQLPLLRAAEQDLEAARHQLADAQAAARAEGARLAATWKIAEQQVLRYREGILPETSATLDAARSSYLAGRTDFSTLIEDFDLWLEARTQLARREADRFAAWAELTRLTGPLDGPPAAPGRTP